MTELATPTDIPRITLTNGFVAIQVYAQDNGENNNQGIRRYTGTVLGQRKNSKGFHDYAVWSMWYDERDEDWECNGGDYFDDLDQARYQFGLRLMRNCWGATLRAMKDRGKEI
jgi:hypothetical protein